MTAVSPSVENVWTATGFAPWITHAAIIEFAGFFWLRVKTVHGEKEGSGTTLEEVKRLYSLNFGDQAHRVTWEKETRP